LTQQLLDEVGVTLDAFTLVVSAADDDAEIAAYLREHAAPESYARWNAFITKREPRGGNRAEAATVYPWLTQRPDLTLVLDVLEEDDRRAFATPPQR
jgi:hypothetical protein